MTKLVDQINERPNMSLTENGIEHEDQLGQAQVNGKLEQSDDMFSTGEEGMKQEGKTRQFPVNGQGTFIYTRKFSKETESGEFAIVVTPENRKAPKTPEEYIVLKVECEKVEFVMKRKDEDQVLLAEKYGDDIGCDPEHLVTYWYSYDRDACILKYGKGYRMVETTLLQHDFLKGMSDKAKERERKKLANFFNPSKPIYVMVFVCSTQLNDGALIDVQPTFQFEAEPLMSDYPPFVKDSADVTLFDIDRNQYIFSKSLPIACQELYYNIKNLKLEFPENPIMKLSEAIRYSLETRGMMLYRILQKKIDDAEFGDKSEVYIRVTLGPDMRTGPGIPYVLEIWPRGCKSPVHNHGAANAVIKVLFGQIQVKIFNKGTNPPKKSDLIKKFDAKEGDVTWMDQNWYQRHQLINRTNDFCATIQCYRYAPDDKLHWPGFDFVTAGGEEEKCVLDTFLPNSDATFLTMRNTVLKEYERYLVGDGPKDM